MSSNEFGLFLENYSYLEAMIAGIGYSIIQLEDNYVINPSKSHVCTGKNVIIDLPFEKDYDRMSRVSNLISRFELPHNIKHYYMPYKRVEFKRVENKVIYDKRILNKYLLREPGMKISINDNFLLSADTEVGNDITLAGYIILKSIKR